MAVQLYLIPTIIAEATVFDVLPNQIGNAIKAIDCFLVEEIRTARRFISSLKLGVTIESLDFVVMDKKSDRNDVLSTIKRWQTAGKNIGVLSEAGCPGIADPGAMAVSIAHQLGIKVVPLVGPSSIFLALMASGFSGQSFVFHGYLPIDKEARAQKLKTLEQNASKLNQSQIFMETPFRNQSFFNDMLQHLQPDTELCLAVDITGKNEFIKTQKAIDWRKSGYTLGKMPAIFIIGQSQTQYKN